MSAGALRRLLLVMLLVAAAGIPARPASAAEDRFALAERARYSALCRTRRDLDSCSDAVRWSPGDPVLTAALADALVRAGRVPEALRDYRRAEALDPDMRGLDAKIKSAEARLNQRNKSRKAAPDRAAAEAATKRYTNVDPEAQSH